MPEKTVGRVLPHNINAEKAILGAILINPNVMNEIESKISPLDFYQVQHQVIYSAIEEIFNRGMETLDIVVLTDYLTKEGNLEKAGGAPYVASLSDQDLIVRNINFYVDTIKTASKRRKLYELSASLVQDSFDETKNIVDSIDSATQELTKLSLENQNINVSQAYAVDKIITSVYEDIITRAKTAGAPTGKLKTGFVALDGPTNGGLNPADYVIIAARPSIGKTAFGISLMLNLLHAKKKVAFFSLEMASPLVAKRMIAISSNVSTSSIEKAMLNDQEIERIIEACNFLFEADAHIVDIPNISLTDLKANARSLHREVGGLDCIIIDYIGLISLSSRREMQQWEKIAEISKSLKNLARELNIPIIVLCQVNRDSEEKEPILSNLRDSGSIEQDADLVCFLHRKRVPTSEDYEKGVKLEYGHTMLGTKLIVAKNRNGATDSGVVGFIPTLTKFANCDRDIYVPLSSSETPSRRNKTTE